MLFPALLPACLPLFIGPPLSPVPLSCHTVTNSLNNNIYLAGYYRPPRHPPLTLHISIQLYWPRSITYLRDDCTFYLSLLPTSTIPVSFPPSPLSFLPLPFLHMDYDRNDALLHWLFRQTQGDAWFRPNEENISSGVALRINDSPEYRVFPYETPSLEPFEVAVSALNPVVAIKVRSAAVHAALAEV